MVALRVVVRRLVSGSQAPAAAMDRATRSTASSAAAAGKGCEDQGKLLTEIHNMREELYDKVLYAQRTYNIPGRAGKNISQLRRELGMQVDPRPRDTTWHAARVIDVLDRCMGFVALSFCWYVLMSMATGKIIELDPDEKQWIKKKRGEAHKQSETK